LVKRDCL